ncbi:serine hydrolase domain-containing protein [Oceanirhabdus seepicola]|uniref:Beta-lactamase family protein n=1 Tax=Oceanirhabdus seepicola TaxID=2828781 RepID=A0A9J6NYF1_9CLOT|nr:serine hydrolase domain-containing protein [Oceanirhabdus seepicola]MCM1989014.1 beta-lactamase family protein [Oceanirhabdus seepicola]
MVNRQMMDKVRINIDNYFNKLEGNERFSGVILVSINGEKVVCKGYGMANYELEIPNKSNARVRIGSVTKQFTAAIILQLCEKGLLNLDDTLDKYIPDYPDGNKVTIHHLLTHTSGIFNSTRIEGFLQSMRNKHSVEELINEFKHLPYDFEPGTKYSYSNSGYILLGYIIEKVSKMTYEEYLHKNIFDKSSMNDSGYDDFKKIIKGRASGYALAGEEKTLANCDFIDMSVPYAAGALYSTVEDLYNWNNKLIKGEILSENSLNQMLSKHVKTEECYYGYGLFLDDIELGGKVRKKVWHTGGIPGFLSCSKVFPDDDIQIIMITNIASEFFAPKVSDVEAIVFEHIQ